MTTVLLVIVLVMIALLIFTSAISIEAPQYSQFEIERRRREGSSDVEGAMYFSDLLSLQRVVVSLFLVLSVLGLVAYFDWVFGVIFGVVLALEYGAIARIPFIRSIAEKQYRKYEPKLIGFIKAYPKVANVLRTITTTIPEPHLHSREELLHLIENSGMVLSHDEKQMVAHGLSFSDRLVSEVMTPRSVVDSVEKSELLGPLVLNDLHKTGHSRLPVISGDLDHVVGMLYLRDLLTLDTTKKHTSKVETVMDKRVFYIHEDQTLAHALAAFLRTHHHLFVVVNEYRETVGLLSLEDVIEVMLGRKIVDEFDAHDDLRAVAARNPRGNNKTSSSAKDV